MPDDTETQVTVLLDILLPGGGDWPAARTVLGPDDLSAAALSLARTIAGLPQDERADATAAFETAHPGTFADLYFAVADAYYATPQVARVLQARASTGPPDTSGPHFDRSLLDGVMADQRGKRRL